MKGEKYILVTVAIKKEGTKWLANCNELGTATFGKSFEDVVEKIKEAMLLHIETLEEVGELDRFFKEHNIPMYDSKPKLKKTEATLPVNENNFTSILLQPIPA